MLFDTMHYKKQIMAPYQPQVALERLPASLQRCHGHWDCISACGLNNMLQTESDELTGCSCD